MKATEEPEELASRPVQENETKIHEKGELPCTMPKEQYLASDRWQYLVIFSIAAAGGGGVVNHAIQRLSQQFFPRHAQHALRPFEIVILAKLGVGVDKTRPGRASSDEIRMDRSISGSLPRAFSPPLLHLLVLEERRPVSGQLHPLCEVVLFDSAVFRQAHLHLGMENVCLEPVQADTVRGLDGRPQRIHKGLIGCLFAHAQSRRLHLIGPELGEESEHTAHGLLKAQACKAKHPMHAGLCDHLYHHHDGGIRMPSWAGLD